MATQSTIAEKVRKARKKAGLSQDKLAREADVAYNTIVKIESGENPNPTIETLKKVAKALDVSVEELI
jgi:transcriptional regulator with XRE-family HTH domain